MKTDNSDNEAVRDICEEIAKAERKMTILKRDKLMLTTKLDLLCQKIGSNRKNVKSFRSGVGGEDNETGSDAMFSNSNHVQSERF